MKFIAYTTKGLEFVSEKEISSKIFDAQIIEVGDKRIIFESNATFEKLTELRTVDDLGLIIQAIPTVETLDKLILEIDKIDFNKIKKELDQYREIASNNFSITTGIVGVKNFVASDLVKILSKSIYKKYNWSFTELDHTNLDIRIFIDRNIVYISVRLTKESLQHRLYKTISKEGSLKPTIAAAMVYLATDGKINLKIVDNFCGSGTVLAESLLMGNQVCGGDIDPKSVIITRKNLANLGYDREEKVKHLNATSTKWSNQQFDAAVSNLPWGKQIEIQSIIKLYEGTISEYIRILKPDGIICVLISNPELFIKFVKKYKQNPDIKTFKICLLGQNPTIVLVK